MTENIKTPNERKGVRDEIKEQQLKTKDMSFKGKLQYFWYSYKVHTIVGIIAVFFLSSLLHDILTAKDFCFYGIMLNSQQLSDDALKTTFSEYAELDTEKFECFIDTESTLNYSTMTEFDMATAQKLIALVQTADLDAVVFDSEIFNNYSNNEMFLDLTTVFTADELAKYKDNLYYIDYAVVQAANDDVNYDNDNIISTDEDAAYTIDEILAEAETHRHPENMEQPIPVGVFVTDSPFAVKSGAYGDFEAVFGVSATTTRIDTAKQYLEYLWDDSIDFGNMKKEF